MPAIDRARQPFQEQIDFFRKKVNMPTATWRDVWQSCHDRAFVVAGAAKADLLDDFRKAVDASIADGDTIDDFAKNFDRIVGDHGWEYNGTRDWRLRVIYKTNMSTSYNAGRLQQLRDPDLLRLKPFWMYKHSDSVVYPRPLHVSWNNITLPADHPWWRTHYPPNGWGCHCRIVAKSLKEADKEGGIFKAPDDGIDETTGVPAGIDEGWAYMPGDTQSQSAFVKEKAKTLPPPLAKAFLEEQKPKPAFEPQKTATAAAKWAREKDLADTVDYKGIKPEVANAWNQSLFEHLQEFPELRANQRYTGTCQGQYRRWHEIHVARTLERLKEINPDIPEDRLLKYAKKRVKRPKMKPGTFAHSWNQKDVSGIGVNQVWGNDPQRFNDALSGDVKSGYHPIGADSIKSVVDHELGHQLDSLLGLRTDAGMMALHQTFADQIREELSGYGAKNIAEFIAEAWAEYRNNPTPRTIATQVGDLIHERYEQFKRNS